MGPSGSILQPLTVSARGTLLQASWGETSLVDGTRVSGIDTALSVQHRAQVLIARDDRTGGHGVTLYTILFVYVKCI